MTQSSFFNKVSQFEDGGDVNTDTRKVQVTTTVRVGTNAEQICGDLGGRRE